MQQLKNIWLILANMKNRVPEKGRGNYLRIAVNQLLERIQTKEKYTRFQMSNYYLEH